jgi:hypothetical protein
MSDIYQLIELDGWQTVEIRRPNDNDGHHLQKYDCILIASDHAIRDAKLGLSEQELNELINKLTLFSKLLYQDKVMGNMNNAGK